MIQQISNHNERKPVNVRVTAPNPGIQPTALRAPNSLPIASRNRSEIEIRMVIDGKKKDKRNEKTD